jgi:hypothetical protein
VPDVQETTDTVTDAVSGVTEPVTTAAPELPDAGQVVAPVIEPVTDAVGDATDPVIP